MFVDLASDLKFSLQRLKDRLCREMWT